MGNKIVEVTEDNGEVSQYLKDNKGKTIKNLNKEADENLYEATIDDKFIYAEYNDSLGNPFSAIFNGSNGNLIKKGINIEIFIPEREEFIITTNSEGDDFRGDYPISSKYSCRFAVINKYGDYVIQPDWEVIEHIADGIYLCNENSYYNGSEFLGTLIKDYGNEMLLENEQGYLLFNKIKGQSTEKFEKIFKGEIQIGDLICFIAIKNGKYGVVDSIGKKIIEFKYDWIDEDFYLDEHAVLILKKDKIFKLIKISESAEVVDFSRIDFEFCKFISTKERGKTLVGFESSGLANLYQLDNKLKTVSNGCYITEISKKLVAIIRVDGKYGVIDNSTSKKPLLPFVYDTVELIYAEFRYILNLFPIITFNGANKLYEIWDFSQQNYETNEFTPIISSTTREKAFQLYKDSIKLESIEQFLMN